MKNALLPTLAVSSVLVAGYLVNRYRSKEKSDQYFLEKAQTLREALPKPQLSDFRVVCLLLLANGDYVLGTNDEPSPWLGNSICAERAALVSYRQRYMGNGPRIRAAYVVTDASEALSPGMLCREYCSGYFDADTRIILQSCDVTSAPLETSLSALAPYPHRYTKWDIRTQWNWATTTKLPRFENVEGIVSEKQLESMIEEARKQTVVNRQEPIAYGATALLPDSTMISAGSVFTLEYGGSQDALCQLWSKVNTKKPKAVVFVDALGHTHTPFAVARSVWAENGGGDTVLVWFHYDDKSWKAIPMKTFAPATPNFRDLI